MAAITFVGDDGMEKGEATVAPVYKTHFWVVDDLAAEGLVVGRPNGREVGVAKLLERAITDTQVGKGAVPTVDGEELRKGEGRKGQRCHAVSS
ncbi:hypothetical protein IV203_020108 [Nitzschia inconspicua]|uniref:Uncharacterized protein n=1 Tax=Nitzschia inconspicua TaxID=303405 RepID=A0A9K3M0R6_9STRA|nr:hypothetical protein IV203_020477 [Nitzschia inconspicua]KAG7371538.1 hypothetical protein IV203_020108 [Nitzschia inconspicua]